MLVISDCKGGHWKLRFNFTVLDTDNKQADTLFRFPISLVALELSTGFSPFEIILGSNPP